VLSLVSGVSDDKSLPKPERKRLQVANAHHKSAAAKQIKLADKIHNVLDITQTPPSDWSMERKREYLEWASAVVAGLRGTNEKLDAAFDAAIKTARFKLESDLSESFPLETR
jgi:guanosine-3',5'-bis(diphosphate) 3'-pyrophosphohydrolase